MTITGCSVLCSNKNDSQQDEIDKLRKVIASIEKDIPKELLEECQGLTQIQEPTMDGIAKAMEANARSHLECLHRHKALVDVLERKKGAK